ncbi:MAG: ion channel [Cyanobacteria bacterium P01_D01_bin.44]
MKSAARSQAQKYQQLLFVLIVTFFISPFLKAGIGQVFSALLLLSTIIVTIRSFALPKLLFSVYSAIALMAFGLELAANLGWIPFLNQTFALLAQAIYALYLGGAAYWVGRDIFRSPEVTADTVRGGISVYLLLGFVWALFYGMVATLDAGAFSEPLLLQESYLKALHFSFTTLTTLGYGDIVPMSDIALVLTNLEAIIGQMYSTVFIAILVGGYLSRRSKG